MFESFNQNPNEVTHVSPAQIAAAEAILEGSTLSLEEDKLEEKEKKTFGNFGIEFDPALQQRRAAEEKNASRGAMGVNPFDEAGRHVPGDEEAERVAKIMKGTSADKWTLQ